MRLLILSLWVAFALRLIYVRQISPFVDEHISMLAMQSIIEHGAPVLPSGLFYGPKGLLHSYMGALFFLTIGPSEFSVRFLSVLAGVITVCCVYRAGRDWFSPTVGLLAAVALTWLPSTVEWGGRVRMYGLLQLLSLVGGYLLISDYLEKRTSWRRIVGMVVILLAIWTHTLALIVFGGLVVGVAVSRLMLSPKSKSMLIPSIWEVLTGVLFIIAIILLNPMGGVWGAQIRLSEVAQGSLDLVGLQKRFGYLVAFTHQFVIWPLWPLTIFYAIGFINLIFRVFRKSPIVGDGIALGLYVLILCAWVATSILSGLHDDRYLFAIIPFFLLLAVRELYLLIEIIRDSVNLPFLRFNRFSLSDVVIPILIITLFAPSTFQMMGEDTYGFRQAFVYVKDNWQSGDVVATCSPVPSYLVLKRADYYVIQYGAESNNGVDIWTGAPLIDAPERFAEILNNHRRVWFVIEKLCWERHFAPEFQEVVAKNMQVAFDQRGMLIFVSDTRQRE